MNKAIVFVLSLLTSTIAPSILDHNVAFAETPMSQKSSVELNQCALPELKITPPKPLEAGETSGTAKDLQLGGVQKVETRCFLGIGDGIRVPSPFIIKLDEQPTPSPFQIELRYNPEENHIMFPIFSISF